MSSLAKKVKKTHPEIVDIILFGSAVRGKLEPGDIDLAIILKTKADKTLIENEFGKEFHLSFLDIESLFGYEKTLWGTLFQEGISLIQKTKMNKILGMRPFFIYWYNLSKLKYSDKIRFFYALKGRGKAQGILKDAGGESIGKGVLLIPAENDEQIYSFFNTWRLPFHRKRILMSQ